MKTVQINLYEFSELNEKAKTKAISEHYDFLCSIDEWDEINDNTPDEVIIESIEANEYLFYSDGNLANCVTYCGKHPKAGLTELTIGIDIYPVN